MPERTKDGARIGVVKAIGLMSGTSLDGIDVAVLETDGENIARSGPALSAPYLPLQREILRAALAEAPKVGAGAAISVDIKNAERLLTLLHCDAVKKLMKREHLKPPDIAVIGFHGQTILHRPMEHRTWQIGDGDLLARWTRIPVVTDFRSADVAAGGEGAPFVSLYHGALASSLERPLVVVNIGGVANVTYVSADGVLLAFDTGPGNAPIDDWAARHTGEPFDRDGRLGRAGEVDQSALTAMLANPYFSRKPPKSLDRQDFGTGAVVALSAADGAATLTAFTAATIARAREFFPAEPKRWIVCGGGRHNPMLMEELRRRVGGSGASAVQSAETVGWRGDFLEAEAFAYLAVRSMKGLPLSVPTTTGVPRPMPGGRLHQPV